jgi:hypothetical protein
MTSVLFRLPTRRSLQRVGRSAALAISNRLECGYDAVPYRYSARTWLVPLEC